MRRRLARDERGSVSVETLIAFVPLLLAFFGSLQLAVLAVAKLSVQHAATCAARAAIVVLPEEGAGGAPEIEDAASAVLLPFGTSVHVTTAPLAPAPSEMIHVEVALEYECKIPIARTVLCHSRGDGRWTTTLRAGAALPSQGAFFLKEIE